MPEIGCGWVAPFIAKSFSGTAVSPKKVFLRRDVCHITRRLKVISGSSPKRRRRHTKQQQQEEKFFSTMVEGAFPVRMVGCLSSSSSSSSSPFLWKKIFTTKPKLALKRRLKKGGRDREEEGKKKSIRPCLLTPSKKFIPSSRKKKLQLFRESGSCSSSKNFSFFFRSP